MKHQGDSKKRISFQIHLSEDGSGVSVPSVIQILPAGEWDHPYFGKFSIGTAEVSKFVANYNGGVRNRIPITQGHDNGMSGGELPAVGWFTDLEDRGMNGLWGGVDWTDEGKALLTSGAFKYFSAEIYMDYTDPETGEEKECVLVGGALTNKPYFKEMQPVMFSEDGIIQFSKSNDNNMDLKTILAKNPTDLSTEEKAFVREHKAELSAEETTAFASVLGESAPVETEDEKTAREAKELGDANEAKGLNRDGSTKEISASEKGKKVLTLAEFTALETKANAGEKALAKLELSERQTFAEKMLFSKANATGKFLPKQKDALVGFLTTLSEKQRDQFKNLIDGQPQVQIFGEIGDGGNTSSGATAIAKEVDTAVKAKITASEGRLKYSVALAQVYSEQPELKARYEQALGEAQTA